MGAIVSVFGDAGREVLAESLAKMLNRSPVRGTPTKHVEDGFAIGIQDICGDACMAVTENFIVAFHGYLGNRSELLAGDQIASHEPPQTPADFIAQYFLGGGHSLLRRLRGEFAVIIWNRCDRVLFLARDIVGARPLFWHQGNNCLFVATEIRQVIAGSQHAEALNESACVARLLYTYFDPEDTLYSGVFRVAPAEIYRVERPASPAARSVYWDPADEPQHSRHMDFPALAEEARNHIERAIRRAVPNHPFAIALSGGLDSGTVWSILGNNAAQGDVAFQRAHAYSLVFPGYPCDETPYIDALTVRYPGRSTRVDCSIDGPDKYFGILLQTLDCVPIINAYHIYCMGSVIQQRGIERNVITGIGGDEWFQGNGLRYLSEELWHGHWFRVIRDMMTLPLPNFRSRIRTLWRYGIRPGLRRLVRRKPRVQTPAWLTPAWLERVRQHDWHSRAANTRSETRNALLGKLRYQQGGAVLEAIEQGFASFGLAPRFPYMDGDLIELAFRVPARSFRNGLQDKQLLRAAAQDVLPAMVRSRSTRTIFDAPIRRYEAGILDSADPHRWGLAARGIVVPGQVIGMLRAAASNQESPAPAGTPALLWQMECFVRRFRA